MYIGDYLGRRAIYSPDTLAIVDAGKDPAGQFTYTQLNARANRLAGWLRQSGGVGKGDRVAILARDGVEHLDLFFACGKLGAIHVPLNWRLHEREIGDILADVSPNVFFFGAEFAQVAQAVGYGCSQVIDGFVDNLGDVPAGTVPTVALEAEDIAALIFTGGTTGRAKGAQISHRMIAWNSLNTIIHDLHHNDIYLNVFPLFHTGGLFVYTLPQIILGGTTILVRQFEPSQLLELLESHQVTVFAGVPTMYQLLTQAPNWPAANLASLRFCTSGGAPLPVPLVRQYEQEKGIRFKQGFGMTEFGPGIFALAAEDAIAKAGSIGRPNFFVDARIVDDQNRPLGPNQIGELVLKGPSQSSGYFNNPAASAAAVDSEGWFHTGDLAQYDSEWYFTIVDRKKDMFISGGENVYPVEIEAALYEHPAVQQCAVIGLPDARWGEVGLACVVLKKGVTATVEELLAHLSGRLARYKIPRRIELLDSLPISPAGKILKRDLRQQFT